MVRLVDFMGGVVSVDSLAFMPLLMLASIAILLVVFYRPGTCLAASNIYLDPVPRKLFPALVVESIPKNPCTPPASQPSSWSHELPDIPNTEPLIPPRAGYPPIVTK